MSVVLVQNKRDVLKKRGFGKNRLERC